MNAVIAEQIPDLRIVIDHVAHVEVTGEAPDPEWVQGIQTIAKYSNVYCKVSGMVERAAQQPAPDDPAYYVPTLDVLWHAFGEDRLVYGSNWLVCERAAPYETVLSIVTHYIENKGPEAMEKFFWKNSKAAYKWIDR
ncbi:MAG: amidohydrolase [Gemmatimonadetes bacterium]|nr:amidohydrolase [Gemmatimonadota bacterium]